MKKGFIAALLIFPLVIHGRAGAVQEASCNYVSKAESGSKKRSFKVHCVKKGETLYSISRKYCIKPSVIAENNNLNRNSMIKPGMKLKIPSADISLSESDPVKESKKSTSGPKGSAAVSNKISCSEFSWPVKRIVSVTKESDISKGIGIFIKSNPGSKVFCAGNGKVVKIGYMRGYGSYVVVSHGGRFLSVYSMITPVEVRPGRCVRKGEVIGTVNRDSGGVHFQISKSGKPLDPEKILPQRS
ncbi:MAG: peptidoglycan DD-metalloendopeptidase family protein [Spirochaetes bacterium]|nr:peptidoglycan DD-metalloendopeptidase family protein [Spirochaetota bacterium]